ncbi:hypothetical protein [Streptomyces sp. NPDC050485]
MTSTANSPCCSACSVNQLATRVVRATVQALLDRLEPEPEW